VGVRPDGDTSADSDGDSRTVFVLVGVRFGCTARLRLGVRDANPSVWLRLIRGDCEGEERLESVAGCGCVRLASAVAVPRVTVAVRVALRVRGTDAVLDVVPDSKSWVAESVGEAVLVPDAGCVSVSVADRKGETDTV
jgi:hypothetical protein